MNLEEKLRKDGLRGKTAEGFNENINWATQDWEENFARTDREKKYQGQIERKKFARTDREKN